MTDLFSQVAQELSSSNTNTTDTYSSISMRKTPLIGTTFARSVGRSVGRFTYLLACGAAALLLGDAASAATWTPISKLLNDGTACTGSTNLQTRWNNTAKQVEVCFSGTWNPLVQAGGGKGVVTKTCIYGSWDWSGCTPPACPFGTTDTGFTDYRSTNINSWVSVQLVRFCQIN